MIESKDRVIQIFIEESTEVIEQLESQLVILEEYPEDKSIINDIFRGVHTLKGNANSFGFFKLGGFVHYFEDLLDFYREPNNHLNSEVLQLVFDAYDIIQEVFEYEKEDRDEEPAGYHEVLNRIKNSLSNTKKEEQNEKSEVILDTLVQKQRFDHGTMCDPLEMNKMDEAILVKIKEQCAKDMQLFNVVMEFDSDIYLRGYNHTLFFKLFEEKGEVVQSFWYLDKDLPKIKEFNTDESYIKKISLYILSSLGIEEIEDVFEFIAEDNEVGVFLVDNNLQKEEKKEEEIPKETNAVVAPKVAHQTVQAKSIRIESVKLDELFDSIGELVIAQSFIDQNEKIRGLNDIEINQYLSMLNKTTRLIQKKVMNLRMVPIRDTFLKMKRVSRDVSKKTDKAIELVISGEETEIDKTMVDSLSEPLIHLIRNSIDHGIEENVEIRRSLGKSDIGIVNLDAMHKGSNFIIEIKDDGAGIDAKKILQKALSKGVASKEIEYTNEEIYNFLFAPGFSTAKEITDVSGRGVGLDVVKKAIEKLKGKIQVESEMGQGSTFRIILPLTLAIIDGLSVLVKNEIFIIPTLSVVESFRAGKGDIQKVRGKGEFINFRGEILPLIKLGELLEIDNEVLHVEDTTLICIEHERGRYVLQVNELLGRQQVVIKSLSKKLAQVKEISGAAIMGSGDIALILNTEGVRDWLDSGKHFEK